MATSKQLEEALERARRAARMGIRLADLPVPHTTQVPEDIARQLPDSALDGLREKWGRR